MDTTGFDIRICNYSTDGKWNSISSDYEYVFDVYLNKEGYCACVYRKINKVDDFKVIFYDGPADYAYIKTVEYSNTEDMFKNISFVEA